MGTQKTSGFSARQGVEDPRPPISIRRSAPAELREMVIHCASEAGLPAEHLRRVLLRLLRRPPDPRLLRNEDNIIKECVGRLVDAPWFRVYDLIEKIHAALDVSAAMQFAEDLNLYFQENGIGWAISEEGAVVSRGSEAFEASIASLATIEPETAQTARSEIHKALQDLSSRPDPDLTGAIQHGMAALECVAREVTGNRKATLGKILKSDPALVPSPLDEALSKLWGFASNSGRHLREGEEPEREEVELVVGVAVVVSTYLSRRLT